MGHNSTQTLYCSFCGKAQYEVKKLIAGPVSLICDECVILCVDIIKPLRENVGVKYPLLTGYTAGAIAKRRACRFDPGYPHH